MFSNLGYLYMSVRTPVWSVSLHLTLSYFQRNESNVYRTMPIVDADTENSVTSEDVAAIAQRVIKDTPVKVTDYYFDIISKEKLGFLGYHRELKIVIQKQPSSKNETLNLFIKSIPYNDRNKADFKGIEAIYDKEATIFNKIIPTLTENYKGEKWAPICYLAKKKAIVMENLRIQGFKLRGNWFDESTVLKSALSTISRLHGCSILAEAQLNRNSMHPVTINECYPNAFTELTFRGTDKSLEWMKSSYDLAATIAKNINIKPEKFEIVFDQICNMVKPSKVHRNVVCHGDLWTNNIMFADDKPLLKCVLVDFQLARYAPLALDILHLLYMNTSRKFRKEFEQEMIEHYHSTLEKTVRDYDLTKSVKVPTLQEVVDSVNELRLYGTIVGALCLPIALLDPKIATESTKAAAEYEKFIYGNRQEITLAAMEKDNLFKSRLEEVIIELTDICNRLQV